MDHIACVPKISKVLRFNSILFNTKPYNTAFNFRFKDIHTLEKLKDYTIALFMK